MNERTNIPAELRRQVLVEAGHRCAIHTCKYPATELHHIIPWARCRKHTFANLIALCPNCHQMADAGTIDRKALLMYKSRLASAFDTDPGGVLNHSVSTGTNDISSRVECLKAASLNFPPWEVELEYPLFDEKCDDLAQLNTLLKARALTHLLEIRRLRLDPGPADDGWENSPSARSTITESYSISCFTDELVSLRFSCFSYGAGAAHPNEIPGALNFLRNPLTPLGLHDILDLRDNGLKHLGNTIKALLGDRDTDKSDEIDWDFDSTLSDVDSFQHFNLTPGGLVITFSQGSIGPNSDGTREVLISPDRLKDIVRPHSPARGLWGLPQVEQG